MDKSERFYILPSSEFSLCEDRFSILDYPDGEGKIRSWSLIEALLSRPIADAAALVDLLETFALCISGARVPDYGFLAAFLASYTDNVHNVYSQDFFTEIWPKIAALALEMPRLFPEGRIPILSSLPPPPLSEEAEAKVEAEAVGDKAETEIQNKLVFSRREVACLVVHQFLCTLRPPRWQEGPETFQSFHIWYASEQPHPAAVTAYLTALFAYFGRLAFAGREEGLSPLDFAQDGSLGWEVRYELRSLSDDSYDHKDGRELSPLQPLSVVRLPEPSTEIAVLGLPRGAAVISANRLVGFGRTGTQEEAHVGGTPEVCAATLVTPPLNDDQVLVVSGIEAMAVVRGYGRNARLSEVYHALPPALGHAQWSQRTMLFMDALELDMAYSECIPDLEPGNVARERRKAFTAFSARSEQPYHQIFTGFWGCGTFGGNPYIKTVIQWIAASMAGAPLRFICSGPDQHRFADDLEGFLKSVRMLDVCAEDLEMSLPKLNASVARGKEIFKTVCVALEERKLKQQ